VVSTLAQVSSLSELFRLLTTSSQSVGAIIMWAFRHNDTGRYLTTTRVRLRFEHVQIFATTKTYKNPVLSKCYYTEGQAKAEFEKISAELISAVQSTLTQASIGRKYNKRELLNHIKDLQKVEIVDVVLPLKFYKGQQDKRVIRCVVSKPSSHCHFCGLYPVTLNGKIFQLGKTDCLLEICIFCMKDCFGSESEANIYAKLVDKYAKAEPERYDEYLESKFLSCLSD
jgi:hypothetical protein